MNPAETPELPPRNLLVRVYRSLRRRGLVRTLGRVRRHLGGAVSRRVDRRFDGRRALDTAAFVETTEMHDVTSPNLAQAVRYEPTRAWPLRRFLRRVSPSTEGAFVDIGCGKGRVLLLAVGYGFRRVVGVDFSPSLCRTAEDNVARFRSRSGRRFECSVIHCDATEYEFGPNDDVIFMFNPFEEGVMRKVIDNLDASLDRWPRRTCLIYHNPVCHSLIVSRGRFRPVHHGWYGGCEFAAYTNE